MTNFRAAITGIQAYAPDYILTNKELETMVDTTDEWITTRTGIKERHILKGEGLGTSDMAVKAVNGLLEKTGTSPDEIVDKIQQTVGQASGLIINPGAYTHTSIAIRDALLLLDIPIVEVHLSNTYKREAFRRESMIADIVTGRIVGLGALGYILALQAIAERLQQRR